MDCDKKNVIQCVFTVKLIFHYKTDLKTYFGIYVAWYGLVGKEMVSIYSQQVTHSISLHNTLYS